MARPPRGLGSAWLSNHVGSLVELSGQRKVGGCALAKFPSLLSERERAPHGLPACGLVLLEQAD
jgi:hypothetical protein